MMVVSSDRERMKKGGDKLCKFIIVISRFSAVTSYTTYYFFFLLRLINYSTCLFFSLLFISFFFCYLSST